MTLVDKLLEKGKDTVDKASQVLERKAPLDDLRDEINIYQRVERYLCPINNYVPEFLVQQKWDPEYISLRHPDFPKSSLYRGHVLDFFEAKSALEHSILHGKHFTGEKKTLLKLFLDYEDTYISGEEPVKLVSMDTMDEHQRKSQILMDMSQHIFEGYQALENDLQKPYDESLEAAGMVIGGVAVAGVAALLGAVYAGGALAKSTIGRWVLKEGAKKSVGL